MHVRISSINKDGLARRCFVFLIGLILFLATTSVAVCDPALDIEGLKAAETSCQKIVPQLTAATVGIINKGLAAPGRMGQGSGVVVSEDGLILTVGHVLSKTDSEITVVFPDGRQAKAKTLGADRSRDAGMAKIIDKGPWPYVDMGKSADLKPGQWCLAIGHPGGLQKGRTPPVRLGRILSVNDNELLKGFIRSDATVISGDSGGPLFDLDGKVIAIHSNIGIDVTENRHVPVDVYREHWDDFLAGKQTGELRKNITPDAGGQLPDIQKFQRMLQERIRAKDPEVLKLIKEGRLQLTPQKMKELIEKWEKESKNKDDDKKEANEEKKEEKPEDAAVDKKDEETDDAAADKTDEKASTDKKVEDKKEDESSDSKTECFIDVMEIASEQDPDVAKFQKLLQQRLMAGDQEVLDMIKGGRLQLTPQKMKELIEKWENKPGDSADEDDDSEPEKPQAGNAFALPTLPKNVENMAELFKYMQPDENGVMRLDLTPENAAMLMPLIKKLGINMPKAGKELAKEFGKSSEELLKTLAPVAKTFAPSTVSILCDGKAVALGTIVRKNGYLLTKASELSGKATAVIGTRNLPAKEIARSDEYDLALLKVRGRNFKPVTWAEENVPPIGRWLLTPDSDGNPLGLGMVGVATRKIDPSQTMVLPDRPIIGIQLATSGPAEVASVMPGSPGAKVGFKPGDVVVALNGEEVKTGEELIAGVSKFKPGDKVTLGVKRGDRTLILKPVLKSMADMVQARSMSDRKLQSFSQLSGDTVSRRNRNFPAAFTHDTVLQAEECGGPVMNLDGKAVGLNIARCDRTATFALTASDVQKVIGQLMKKK